MIFGIILIYFLIRLPSLTVLPVFCDEAIYIHWAQKIAQNFGARMFLPLTDGKTPLFMWSMIPFLKIFNDPLFAGRLVSVISGLLLILAVYYLAKKFFDGTTALISVLFFTVLPVVVFFDKMALADSLLAACSLWSFVLALETVKNSSWKYPLLLGLTLGIGVWVKTPGLFSFITLPIVLIAYEIKKPGLTGLFQKTGLLILSGFVGFAIYSLLRLSPDFPKLNSRNEDYYFPLSRLSVTPFDPLLGHIELLWDWMTKLVTWPVIFLISVSILMLIMKKNRISIALFLWGFLPLLSLAALLRVFTVRYILFSLYPLIILAGWALNRIFISHKISNKLVQSAITLLILVPALSFDYYLSVDPAKAPLPQNERSTYLEEWTAGYGLREIADYLTAEAEQRKILVLTDGFFGTLPDGLQIYLKDNPNIEVWYIEMTSLGGVYKSTTGKPKYLVVHKSHGVNEGELDRIKEYPRAVRRDGNYEALVLYRVKQ